MHLESFRIGPRRGAGRATNFPFPESSQPLPGGFFYVPEFITPAEEHRLIDKVNSAPRPRWKQLSNRRCVCADLAPAIGWASDRTRHADL